MKKGRPVYLLSGDGRFIADIALPRMLDIAFLRSPVPHARIGVIDVSAGDGTSRKLWRS